jgi:hypothetical protein
MTSGHPESGRDSRAAHHSDRPTVERRRSALETWPPATEQSYWRTRPVIGEVLSAMAWAGRSIRKAGGGAARRIGGAVGPPAKFLRFRLASVVAAQMFDLGTFSLMVHRHGIDAELNPIVAQGFEGFGMPLVAVAKGVLVVLVGSIVVLLARDRPLRPAAPKLAAMITVLAVFGGLLGGISNVLTI